ncbi:MAG TPA: tetratricopeptide repeat protein [Planctomycetota bacterium]|nr:tetratricopeptide repeat protein [Planctomycetota bacterium]
MGSHHQLAMQAASEQSVLGDFSDASFEHAGVTSTFFRRDGAFLVRTDGPEGALADFEIADTFGVFPLQQYLVAFPGGRLQALDLAWDARPAAQGGQRWFSMHPGEARDRSDPLHWTGRYQNWNLMCAECHSTDLRKGYDAATDSYATTFSEISVGCEACHGPGRRHVAWAANAKTSVATAAQAADGTPAPSAATHAPAVAAPAAPYAPPGDDGLAVHLHSDWAGAWTFPVPGARHPERKEPLDPAVNEACAACHARRATLVQSALPGAPFEDSLRLALLTDPNYHADGQQRDEVYTWGSFLQSRMHAAGVACVDCHDPHSSRTRLPGNALCARCHAPELFDTPAHHHHEAGGAGGSCVACHMPVQTYMVVHERQDHSLRVPRPDLSMSVGSPNACTQCHADRQAPWAAAAMDGWYGAEWRARPQWGTVLRAGATRAAGALAPLLALAGDGTMPGIVRATAVSLAQPQMQPEALPAALPLLADVDPLVRREALGLLEPFDASTRAVAAAALLSDPVRGVRLEAARLLADVPDAPLDADARAARSRALDECLAALELNADWPAENVNRGNLAMLQGRPAEAVAAYQRALALDPRFLGASVNLADALRQLGRESEGEQVLRRALELSPRAADLHHALGLLLVRRQDLDGALPELARAAQLAPENARFAYVQAVGLHSAGRTAEALEALRAADARHPSDLDLLGTLISVLHERGGPGDAAAALVYARRLDALLPGNPQVRALIEELQKQP